MGKNNKHSRGTRSRQHDRENKFNSANAKKSSQNENNQRVNFSDNEHEGLHEYDVSRLQSRENELRELKSRKIVCSKCGLPISEIASALADKQTGKPVHFDCVLNELQSKEKLSENERISYIGQGRFAVLHFENIHDTRHFTIVKTIEWEERDAVYEWRTEMSSLYSHVE